jgi:UDP-glucose 4-epimerase
VRLLVTGGTGFIGHRLLAELAGRHEIVALARTARPADSTVHWVEHDLREPLDAARLPRRIDAVLHLAQSPRYKEFPAGAADVYAVTVQSTFALIEWAREARVQTFVLVSTGGLYVPSEQPVDEDSPIHAGGFYFRAKHAAELMLGAYAGLLRPVVLRPFFVYGEGQRRMLIGRLIEQIAAGEEIVIEGHPGLRCNPVHVDDMVRVFEPVLTAPVSGPINIAGPDVASMSELIAALGEAIGVEPVVRHRPAATAGDLVAATARLRDEVGVTPSVGLRDGLRRVAAGIAVSEPRSPAR